MHSNLEREKGLQSPRMGLYDFNLIGAWLQLKYFRNSQKLGMTMIASTV